MDDRKRPLVSENSQHPNKKVVYACVSCFCTLTRPQVRLVSRKKKAGFDDEIFSETSYYIRNG